MDAGVGWVDLCLLGALLLSTLVGALRGLVFELLGLAGWFVAYFAAGWLAPLLAPHLPVGAPDSTASFVAAFALAFIAVLIVWGLAARLVRTLVHATPLRPGDRLLGAAFGLLRGIVALLVLTAAIGFTPLSRLDAWRLSKGADVLGVVLQQVRPLLLLYLLPSAPVSSQPTPV